ncbi:hypothetical protein [Streptomyces atriruber]|uniref:hypothetical protein n=1 Tax=Streptomyces atriruber TaxID=545121 RepID=UPI0012FEECA4|nr:hypothetical protein [Streptomyces atriruber]
MSSPLRVAVCCGAVLAAVLAGGCAAEPRGLRVEGPALQPSRAAGPVYLADAAGLALQQPTSAQLTEDVVLSELSWRDWGGPTARATGKLGGPWCRPKCSGEPYDATLTLSGLEQQERLAYYRRATVEPKQPTDLPAAAVNVQFQGIRLSVPDL